MICSKCGAVVPDDAAFCGECGAKFDKPKTSPAALAKAKKETKRYKIISIILSCLCVVLGIGWIVASNDPYSNLDNYEKEALDVERAGLELSGTYVVGEDAELPVGRYNIYPADGESYVDVDIYANMEDARQEYDDDYNSLAVEHIYSMTRGFKLKEGQVVVIDYDSAFFELVEGSTTEETQAEAGDTQSEADDTGTDTEDSGSEAEDE